jgi:ferric-dicitrate binding protein FerR (iron transport regulator)
MSAERVDELWSWYLEGELDAAGMQELQTLLESQPGQIARAADVYEIHRLLGMVHQTQSAGTFARATRERLQNDREAFVGSLKERLRAVAPERPPRSHALPFVAAAAALVAAVFLIQLLKSPVNPVGDGAKNSAATPARPVATLVRVERARWEPDVTLVEGQRLEPGALRLGNGRAVLLFDNGAVVAAKGPTDLELESRGSVRLLQGRITVRAEGDAAGFTVRTPAGDARDLGTEFSVAVAINGASEVHVRQGEVAWLPKADEPPSRVLHAGEAARFDSVKEAQGHQVVFAMQSLDDFLQQVSASIPPEKPSAYEGFAYGAGVTKPEAAGGGVGWNGPWRLRRGAELTREVDTNDAMAILPGSLQEPSPVDVHGGALEFQPGYSIRVRQLAEPIDLGRDAVYYLSFRLRRLSGTVAGMREPPHFRLTLRKEGDFWGPSIGTGLPASGHPTLQLHSRDTYASPVDIASDVTTLWVMKIVARRTQPDEAFLKVFKPGEELTPLEPAPWTVVTDRFNFSGVVDLVVLTGSGPGKYVFDELRVGRTWDSVVRKD